MSICIRIRLCTYFYASPVPEIIDPVFAKTSQNARFLLSENERFGLVFVKTGSINSGTDPDPIKKRGQVNKDTNFNVNSGTAEVLKHFLTFLGSRSAGSGYGSRFGKTIQFLDTRHYKI